MKFQTSAIKKGVSASLYIATLLFITMSIASIAQLHQLIENNHRAQAAIKKEWINNNPIKKTQFGLYQHACVFHKETSVSFTPIIEGMTIDAHEACAKKAGVSDYYRLIKRSQEQLQPAFPLNLIVTNLDVITNV
ncbi:hypothetical protein [Aliivibrio fischeri]|uniref:hypothetical protein n=1 Tax=Aliivibrio fischeri TaxID=668 RepID=UPI00084C906D|nr:hypothetical protein [Aliivibrio fischeri]OED53640.1 hypothetical protein BEI47_17450 [Aliivibrio fischeri]